MHITVVEPDGTGGLAHFGYELCRALALEGHDVRLITSCDYELAAMHHNFEVVRLMRLWPRLNKAQKAPSATVRRLRRAWRGVRLTWEWARTTSYVLRSKTDVVLFSEILYPHLAAFLYILKRNGKTLAQVCHEFAYQEREGASGFSSQIKQKASRAIYDNFDQIFFLAEVTRNEFLKQFPYPPSQTRTIPHGGQSIFSATTTRTVDLRKRFAIAPDEPVVLCFGNIRPSKGLDHLIEAFAQSAYKNEARLLIVGAASRLTDLDELYAQAKRLSIMDRIVWEVSYVPLEEVEAYFDLARCVVLPYKSATQSGVLHLAFQLGRPVVATAVGGIAEDVLHGETGILVPAGEPAALAAGIDQLLGNRAAAEAMGKAAKDHTIRSSPWRRAAQIIAESTKPGTQRPRDRTLSTREVTR